MELDADGVWRRAPRALELKSRVGRVYRPARQRLEAAVLDRRIETAAAVDGSELGFARGTGFGFYEASGWFYLRRGLRGHTVTADDVFADFGSGKGRVVYQAARLPFARVIGFELVESLNQIARSNIERNRPRLRCSRVEITKADISTVPVPDDLTVAYAFNPVQGDLFRGLIANICQSLERRPRRLRFIYGHPIHAEEVTRSGHLSLVARSFGIRRDLDPEILIYETSRTPPATLPRERWPEWSSRVNGA
jgi:SAM-dependent methyltransferase